MHNYLTLVKHHVKVIIIDNSAISNPAGRKLEALSEIRDDSPFLKTLVQNVSEPSTVWLMPMTITKKTGKPK